MTLRRHLNFLVLAAIAPVFVVMLAGVWLMAEHEREAAQRDAIGRVRSAMTAIDAELRGTMSSLETLRVSENLKAANIAAFYAEAQRVLRIQPNWLNIGLVTPDRVQIFDAVLPLGSGGRPHVDDGSFEQVLRTGKPVIGGVATGPAITRPAVRVRVPVPAEGTTRYVLSVPIDLASLERVLHAQALPNDWVVELADRDGRSIVRMPSGTPGEEISERFHAAIKRSREGLFVDRTTDGGKTYTPYVTSSLSGWVLGVAVPAAAINAGAYRAIATMVIGGVLGLGVALVLARFFARRVSAPIADLAAAAAAIGRGEEARPRVASHLSELVELRRALDEASLGARERERLLEREKQALEHEKNVLSDVDRAKDEFLAMLSHELRNPLAALSSGAHVLAHADPAHPAFANARDAILRQTRHMRRLIEDLLDVSSVVMGKFSLRRDPLELGSLVSEAVAAARECGRFDGHRLTLDAETVWVDADRARIEQVVANLLDNALKFTPREKGIHVEVKRDGANAALSIVDEGAGFPATDSERIFGLFVQADQGLQRAAGGLGIGLTLVRRIVELHGGRVSAQSAGPERGARVTVSLPAVVAPQRGSREGDAAQKSPASDILLVEDSDDVRATLRDALALSGHRVHEASDGRSALELASRMSPSVALIDIGLPDIDGYEVARRLRTTRNGTIALIALTGYGSADDRRGSLTAGFDVHLTKPIRLEELEGAIARVLAARTRGEAGSQPFA